MVKNTRIAPLLVLIWLIAAQGSAQELPLTHFTSDSEIKPLPATGVTEVFQDRQGFLWLTIFTVGLVRYDGNTMKVYGRADGLMDLNTNGLAEDTAGYLWVNSATGIVVSKEPLEAYANGRRVQFTSRWGTTHLDVVAVNNKSFAVDAKGAVWIGASTGGIIRYRIKGSGAMEADTFRTDVRKPGQDELIYSLAVRKDGTVWAGSSAGMLLAYNEEAGRYEAAGVPGGGRVDATTTIMYEDAAGTLWGGCNDGRIWRLEDKDDQPQWISVGPNLEEWVEDIMETPDGRLWFSSLGSGLLRLDPYGTSPPVTYTQQDGLLSNTINGGTVDREGNLWIGSDQGLSRIRYNYEAFGHFTAASYTGEQPALPAATVTSVEPMDQPGEQSGIWAGTTGGLAFLRPADSSTFIRQDQGLPSNIVYALEKDIQGRIWVGLNGMSAVLLPEGTDLPVSGNVRFHVLPQLERRWRLATVPFGSVYFIKRLPLPTDEKRQETEESLWFLSYHKIVCLLEDTWFVLRVNAGFPATTSSAIAVDDSGYVWVGTDEEGLFRSKFPLSRERMYRLPAARDSSLNFAREITVPVLEPVWNESAGKPLKNIQALIWHSGMLWIGTPEGLFVLEGGDPDALTRLRIAENVRQNNVMSLAVSTATNTLWGGTSGGLVEIGPGARKIIRIVTRQDGLTNDEVSFHGSVSAGADGAVYFGTPGGLALYRPALDRPNPVPPPVHIRKAQFTEDHWGNNEFTINYAAPSLTDERAVRYKTRLRGYRDAWSAEKDETAIHLTNLSAFLLPKEYTFEVLASNNSGVWTKAPASYSFTVQPAWWLRWWACLLYLLVLTGFIAGGLRLQRTRIARQEREKSLLLERELRAEAAEAWANYLQAENERQTQELERARALQLSLLPQSVPEHPVVKIAVHMKTATEVGGDYYDFYPGEDGTLTLAIGDATGHGAQAGTVVTAAKTLFTNYADEPDSAEILHKASRALRRMHLPRLYMAFALGKLRGRTLELAGAGMPPALVYRARSGEIEEVPLKGIPLGGSGNFRYNSKQIELQPGETVILMSDGFPELRSEAGQMIGYEGAVSIFAEVASCDPEEIIEYFIQRTKLWTADQAQDDDITFMVMKAKPGNQTSRIFKTQEV